MVPAFAERCRCVEHYRSCSFFIAMSPADTSTLVLPGHPDAVWRGAQDGGYYIEITRSNPPDYFVQVWEVDSTVEREGWARFITPDGKPLTMARINGSDGCYLFIDSYGPITPSKGERPQ